jgi:pilin isopeptide linkage protein
MRLDFTECGFTEPGIYRYVITEDNPDQDGVTYDPTLTRTIDVYVEDATYTPYTSGTAGETQNKLRIAGYVMYKGTVADAPAKPGTANPGTASKLEDGLANTAKGDNGAIYGTPNGYEVSGTTKSEGFKNTYVTHELTFSKEVTGNQASKDKFFKFKLEIKNVVKDSLFDVDITNAESSVPADVNSATQSDYKGKKNAAKLAADTAIATVDGDVQKVFANQQKFLEQHDKDIKADILKQTPKPGQGGTGKQPPAMTLEKYRKLSDREQLIYAAQYPEEFSKLNGG